MNTILNNKIVVLFKCILFCPCVRVARVANQTFFIISNKNIQILFSDFTTFVTSLQKKNQLKTYTSLIVFI